MTGGARPGTLLADSGQPDSENPADYYIDAITNHYPRVVPATAIDGAGTHSPAMM